MDSNRSTDQRPYTRMPRDDSHVAVDLSRKQTWIMMIKETFVPDLVYFPKLNTNQLSIFTLGNHTGISSPTLYLRFAYNCFIKPFLTKKANGLDSSAHQDRLEAFYAGQADIYDDTRSRLLRGRSTMLKLCASELSKKFPTHFNELAARPERRRDMHGLTNFDKVYMVDITPSLCKVAEERFRRLGWTNVSADPARQLSWLSRWFWAIWFDADNIYLHPCRRDYLEHKFKTIITLSKKNWGMVPLFGIPYYVWIGIQKGADELPTNTQTRDNTHPAFRRTSFERQAHRQLAFCNTWPAAWLVWHKDAVAASPQNVGFVAIDTETNKLIGSVLTRYRTKEYSPAMESDANGEIQSWWRAELSDSIQRNLHDPDTVNSYKLMENWGKCYEKSAEDVHTWLAGKSYLYVRQMGVDPEYRNQGAVVLDEARIRNCDAVQLESWGKGRSFMRRMAAKNMVISLRCPLLMELL
ncbi:hypothetical protein BCR33DRAFT_780313 [Rhizoclosmatium globosum]|uniref:Uncharacterized protein n=1 Tax=Rhizoclosmatium globosum TaxID=329046 RepID=A0A1Y2CWB0_9FUNG|nr:hypothetical protein BCR33DRAFT_780313 [Rhizoclosmatium globosum]|eukprot:ORY51313.1 hypothetical protein BCR33DRAFT_780313 [Rhizoclosmatium globosum]